MDKSSSARLLLLCSRPDPAPSDLLEAGRILERGVDWDWLISRSEGEGTDSLLYWNLRLFPQTASAGNLQNLKARFLRTLARNSRVFRALEPLLGAVRAAGARVALTKGARLAHTSYPEVGLRPFGDVDCIVHPGDWDILRKALADSGFIQAAVRPDGLDLSDPKRLWTYSPYYRKGELLVEVHFNHMGLLFPFGSEEDFWDSTRLFSFGGTKARILSPEYELCYLCLHAQQHSYQKLMWLSDIAALVSREAPDWDRVFSICDEERIQPSVFYTLHLVRFIWPDSVPESVLSRFRTGFFMRRVLRFLWPESDVERRELLCSWPYDMPSLLSLWERRDPLLALRTVRTILFPPRAWISYVSGRGGRPGQVRFYNLRRIWRPLGLALKRMVNR